MGNRIAAVVEFQTERRFASLVRPANTTAYAAGDVISDATGDAHLTFLDCANKGPSRLTGVISAAKCWTSGNVATKPDLELWLYRTDIANVADNAAFAPTDAEMLTCIGVIPFPLADWYVANAAAAAAGNAINMQNNVGIPYQLAAPLVAGVPVVNIYGQLVVRNAYVPLSGEVFSAELLLTLD